VHIIDLTYIEAGIHEELVAYVADQDSLGVSEIYRVGIPLIARVAFVLVPMWCGALGDGGAGWRWAVGRAVVTTALISVTFKQVADACRNGQNLMPVLIDAVKDYASLGEISDVYRQVFGLYREPIIF